MAEFFNEPARSWDVLAQQHDRLDDRIASLTDADLTTRPLESIADELTNRYSLNIPVLHEDAATARSEEIVFDPMRSPTRRFLAGRPALTRGLRITVSVPYTGDRRILELRPDTYEKHRTRRRAHRHRDRLHRRRRQARSRPGPRRLRSLARAGPPQS